ncbi:MAG: hypothetical protein ACI9YT_002797, partial [Halobacteriales archaeon]
TRVTPAVARFDRRLFDAVEWSSGLFPVDASVCPFPCCSRA